MVIPWCWRHSCSKCSSPWFVFYIESNQIIQHAFPIITSKYINCIFVCNSCVFASSEIQVKWWESHIKWELMYKNTLPRQRCHTRAFSSIVKWFQMAKNPRPANSRPYKLTVGQLSGALWVSTFSFWTHCPNSKSWKLIFVSLFTHFKLLLPRITSILQLNLIALLYV